MHHLEVRRWNNFSQYVLRLCYTLVYIPSGAFLVNSFHAKYYNITDNIKTNQSINQFIKKHKQYNIKANIEKWYMRTMCFKGQKGPDGTNNCP